MNERAEYFAILAALAATKDYNSVSNMAEDAYQIWAVGNRICKEAGLKNEEEGKCLLKNNITQRQCCG